MLPVPVPHPAPADVQRARQLAGLSQEQCAAMIYRTRRNWQQWEGGERRMDPALFELFLLKIGRRWPDALKLSE